MKTYTIVPRPADGSWVSVPVLHLDQNPWIPQDEISAFAQVCYDEEALYVRLQAIEPNIRAVEDGPLAVVCKDSCLEFFFCPIATDKRYFNIEVNPNGAIHVGFGTCRYDSIRQVGKLPIHPHAERTQDGWFVTYSIPFSYIGLYFPGYSPKSGDEMRANFYKCGDETVKLHYLTWNPVGNPTPDYHLSQYFGTLIYG